MLYTFSRLGTFLTAYPAKSYPFWKTFLRRSLKKLSVFENFSYLPCYESFPFGIFSVCKGNIFFLNFQKIFQLFFHYFSGKKHAKTINYNLSITYVFLHKEKVYLAQNHTLKNLKNA